MLSSSVLLDAAGKTTPAATPIYRLESAHSDYSMDYVLIF